MEVSVTLYRLSCYALTGLGALHMAVLGLDALNYAGGLISGRLWTWEHWGPLSEQQSGLVTHGFAFWSTLGSFAIPMMALGLLLSDLDRRSILVPHGLISGLGAWLAVCSLAMPPSGFPLAVLAVGGLLVGKQDYQRILEKAESPR